MSYLSQTFFDKLSDENLIKNKNHYEAALFGVAYLIKDVADIERIKSRLFEINALIKERKIKI